MKNKGFTLIELLAVIVILAIIALIATPIILNIINDTKKSATDRSKEMYLVAVEQAIARKNLTTSFNPSTCTVKSDGILNCDTGELVVDFKGQKPNEGGTITFDNGKIISNTLTFGNYERAVTLLLNNANDLSITKYIDGNKHEMYTFNHDSTEQTETLKDYRYIGNDPYNYVKLNDDEIWRIVGIFTIENEDGNKQESIKLLRENPIGNMSWNSEFVNNWVESSISNYLNNEYYNNFSEDIQSMIVKAKFYLGDADIQMSYSASGYYNEERGTNKYYNQGYPMNTVNYVGLIYPSDYIYTYALGINDVCYDDVLWCEADMPNSGWIYNGYNQWTISHNCTNGNGMVYTSAALYIHSEGHVSYIDTSIDLSIRPSIYLNSDVKIINGNGSKENPYVLSM